MTPLTWKLWSVIDTWTCLPNITFSFIFSVSLFCPSVTLSLYVIPEPSWCPMSVYLQLSLLFCVSLSVSPFSMFYISFNLPSTPLYPLLFIVSLSSLSWLWTINAWLVMPLIIRDAHRCFWFVCYSEQVCWQRSWFMIIDPSVVISPWVVIPSGIHGFVMRDSRRRDRWTMISFVTCESGTSELVRCESSATVRPRLRWRLAGGGILLVLLVVLLL